MQSVCRREITRGVNLTAIRADKFKTGCLSMTLLTPLSNKTAALNAVLPYVLRRGTARNPDMESIAAALDDLYGTRIEPIVRKKGEVQCVGFYADFPDDIFLPNGTHNLERTAKLMGEMLLSPSTSGGRLRADFVETEKRNLIDDINAEINDKRSYASIRLNEIMFKGEPYGITKLGTLREAEKISVYTLTRHYKELTSTAAVEIFYCGAAAPDMVEGIVREAISPIKRTGECAMPVTKVLERSNTHKPRYVTERMDVTQGRLVMGFRLGDAMTEANHAALMVFNAAFGGAVTSKLFMNVREKLALCYYVNSGIDRHKGALFTSAGIEFDKYDETMAEILRQMDAMRKGDISDWELEGARRAVVSAIYSSMDEPYGLEGLYLDRALLGLEAKPDELAALAAEVTAEELSSIAAETNLDCVYFLTGEDEDAEA